MKEIFEYGILGVLALAVIYLLTPTLLNFYDSAVSALNDTTGLSDSESAIVSAVLLLLLIMFFLFAVWIMYGSVQARIDNM